MMNSEKIFSYGTLQQEAVQLRQISFSEWALNLWRSLNDFIIGKARNSV